MKIAVIIDTWFPFVGGGQINAWEISTRLADKGNKVEIITRNLGKDNQKQVKNLKITKLGQETSSQNQLSKVTFILKSLIYLLRGNYDIIHGHAFLPGITLFLHSKLKNTPTVFTVHGTSIGSNLNGYFSTLLEKIILTKIKYTAQITVSRDFFKLKNVNKQIVYIPNGVNLENFDKIKVEKFDRPTLLFVGRLHPQKNLINLIKAVYLAKKKISNLQLIIVGDGEQKSELANLVKSLNLSKNVTFLGKKSGNDLIKIYKSSHVFILPSLYEGQSLALLEAFAAGIPIITSKTGDSIYLLKDKINGYFIEDPLNEIKISNVIIRVLRSKNKINIGRNGYNTIKNENDWDAATDKSTKLYKILFNF